MRLNGSPAWLYDESQTELIAFEKDVDEVFHDLRLIASCTYPIPRSTADELLDVAGTHQFVLMLRHGQWAVFETPELMQAKAELKKLNKDLELATRLMRAQEDERRRIAQMLHETTAQDLAALKMLLARLRRGGVALSDADRTLLTESIDLTDRSMNDVRTLSYLLHPPFLEENGLLSAVRWYAKGFADRSGIAVDLDVPPTFERLPQDAETTLFRVVQEALINIHRHAQSAMARIRLRTEGDRLTLEVGDHGRGMPADVLSSVTGGSGAPGVGIAGMRERLQQLGGTLHITSSDRGTTLRATVPLQRCQDGWPLG
jgi:signal transduction histidine kinase